LKENGQNWWKGERVKGWRVNFNPSF
jgi:hypothetical protein